MAMHRTVDGMGEPIPVWAAMPMLQLPKTAEHSNCS